MKIIKKVDTSNWKYHVTCDKCDTELEADASDVSHKHYDGDQREPSYDGYYVFCPVCNQQLTVSKDKLPKALQIQIQNRNKKIYGGPFDR